MSALAAIWNIDGRPDALADCRRVMAAQRMYGPHGMADWDDGTVALGCCRYQLLAEDRFDRQQPKATVPSSQSAIPCGPYMRCAAITRRQSASASGRPSMFQIAAKALIAYSSPNARDPAEGVEVASAAESRKSLFERCGDG